MDDEAFIAYVGDHLGALPAVEAVTLGGSRVEGTSRADSDWDFSLYYRGAFDPQTLRDIGWPGTVGEIGGWSAVPNTVFNGGAWLTIDGRATDVHYRDLDVVERTLASAREGTFETEPLWFHLAGLPSYVVLAELATKRVLVGDLPDVSYPPALREHAPDVWWEQAEAEFNYATRYHAASGRLTQCVGLVARAATCAAHAVLAARGIWVTNEKQLFKRANVDGVDELLAAATPEAAVLCAVVEKVRTVCLSALQAAKAQNVGGPA
ncbi:nucleotidyltransferase domain-containing protein [Sinomonas susongensis]|uniref:nucleotidyltransferase domain-containing protein n=1 Tax=Sinomonas susongensis TaxID=1324851 RepID=UPI001109F494|nr:nucleotidyltransferase domain-containing protein [Sinomonas susongensis]